VDGVGEAKAPQTEQMVSLKNILSENSKQIYHDPNLSNDLNKIIFMRIRKNMHFIMTFTPSG